MLKVVLKSTSYIILLASHRAVLASGQSCASIGIVSAGPYFEDRSSLMRRNGMNISLLQTDIIYLIFALSTFASCFPHGLLP